MNGRARIASGDLRGLDALEVDALALLFWEGRAQPLGVAGFVDWRLLGYVARLILGAHFLGARGEALLMPGTRGIGARRIFLLGLGARPDATEAYVRAGLEQSCRVLADARAVSVAVAPPPVEETNEAGEDAARMAWATPEKISSTWLDVARAEGDRFEDVVLLDARGMLGASEAVIAKTAKKLGWTWGGKR